MIHFSRIKIPNEVLFAAENSIQIKVVPKQRALESLSVSQKTGKSGGSGIASIEICLAWQIAGR